MSDIFSTKHEDILSFGRPSDSRFKTAKFPTLDRGASHFFDLVEQLLNNYEQICKQEAGYICDVCGTAHTFAGRDLWCRLFLVTSTYYDFAVRQSFLCKGQKKSGLPKGFNLHVMGDFQQRALLHSTDNVDAIMAHTLLSTYLPSMFAAHFTSMFRSFTPQIPGFATFENHAHCNLPKLFEYSRNAPHGDLRLAASMLTESVLIVLSETYSDEVLAWDKDHVPGPLSAINLRELGMIAKRDQRMIKRYGTNRVEKIFEHQLALLFQSLGFYVVSTRLGHRTIDLICISAIENEPMTLLVEAKTSGKPYGLPVADQRALLEYVRDVRKSLTTIASPSLILLVGQEPARPVEERLRALEAEAITPVRYIRAAHLASLRESFPGPIHPSILRQTFIQSDTRVLANPSRPIVEHERRRHDAHRTYVQSLLQGSHDLASHPWGESQLKLGVTKCAPPNGAQTVAHDRPDIRIEAVSG